MPIINFTKIHGCGNDFIIINDLETKINNFKDIAIKLCHRNFGIGADGILVVQKSNIADIKMIIVNADGSIASMCGNGIRCFAKYVFEKGIVKKPTLSIETGDGIKKAFLNIEKNNVKNVTINMGEYSFNSEEIKSSLKQEIINYCINVNNKEYSISSVFMGVPHTIVFGKVEDYKIEEGENIEKYNIFKEGTNVNFVEVINKDEINVRTWERGAGATLACGTGSCASVVVAKKLNKINSKVKVHVPGGFLFIEIKPEGVFMTGPAQITFWGECEI